jgi:hypothetical protein
MNLSDSTLPAPKAPSPLPDPDKRLDRLFEYTKFHISLCLSAAGALVTLIASAERNAFIQNIIGSPRMLAAALATMIVAAVAGGVIASSTVACRTFDDFWNEPQGPLVFRWLRGRTWAAIEHGAFWVSILLIIAAVLSKATVLRWLTT